jgi:hypothetical protein
VWIIRNGVNDKEQDENTRFGTNDLLPEMWSTSANGNGGVRFAATNINVEYVSNAVFTYYVGGADASDDSLPDRESKQVPFLTVGAALSKLADKYREWYGVVESVDPGGELRKKKVLQAWGEIVITGTVEVPGGVITIAPPDDTSGSTQNAARAFGGAINRFALPPVYFGADAKKGGILKLASTGSLITVSGGSVTLGRGLTLEGYATVDRTTLDATFPSNIGMNTDALVTVEEKGELVLAGAFIQDNYRGVARSGLTVAGAGVEIKSGTFTMTGGTIQYNVFPSIVNKQPLPSYGGGVGISGEDAKFIMEGGSVMNNAALHGGGVAIENKGEFTMTDGTIGPHSAKLIREGGGVYLTVPVEDDKEKDAKFYMKGGIIQGGSAELGGGVCVAGGTFNMTSGTIQGNTGDLGAGVYIGKGYIPGTDDFPPVDFAKTGGVIYGKTGKPGQENISTMQDEPAKKYGGAVWVDIPDTNGKVKIYFNTAPRDVRLDYPVKLGFEYVWDSSQEYEKKTVVSGLQDAGSNPAPAHNLSP